MKSRTLRRFGAVGLVVAMASLLASCLAGPITGPGPISLLSSDPSPVDYRRSEFFLIDFAHSYSPTGPLTSDGKVTVAPDAQTALFKTRVYVDRPVDPADFNGTVIVEWLNVTSGVDLPTDWLMAHNQFVREGYAYVGVSATT